MFQVRISNRRAFCWGTAFVSFFFIAAAVRLTHAASPRGSTPRAEVIRRLRTQFSSSVFKNSPVGVWIESLDQNQVLYQQNQDRPFTPASNLKIVTSAAALSMLGRDYQYRTHLFRTGIVDGDTLRGHLVIRGSGDPTISGRFNDGRLTETLEKWTKVIQRLGISVIDGDVIGDDDAFTDQAIPDGWKADYFSLWYAAQSSALSFNDNCIDLTFRPGRSVGGRCSLMLAPPTKYVTVDNRVTTAPATSKKPVVRFARELDTNRITTSGTVPFKSRGFQGHVTVHNPTLFTATVFKETLESHAIRVSGRAKDIDQLPGKEALRSSFVPLAFHDSPPLATMLPVVNKDSHNFYANQLFLTLGEKTFGTGGWVESASAVISFLNSIEIDPTALRMVDGCGLSPLNKVTPAQLAQILRYIRRHPDAQAFVDSLPIMGTDGTLRTRLRHTPAEKRVFAKTGYIKGVRALSGYLRTREGEDIIFCFLLNNAEPVSGVFRERVDKTLLALVSMK